LEKTVAELVETVKRHEDTLTRLEKTVAELVEAQKNTDRIVAELVEAQKNTDKKVDRLGGLWGGHFETKWREDGTSYLGSQGFRRVRLVSKDALDDLLDEADDAVHDDIRLADAVHSAIRKDTGVQVYVVTEVSSRIHKDDVERALRRAALLHEQLDTECLAAVAGASIDDTAESLATEANAMVVMPGEWQRLTA
jgi:cell division septum initiation protein DivIVA